MTKIKVRAASVPPKGILKGESSFAKRLLNRCFDKKLYFLVFFLSIGIAFAAYGVFGVYPFGEESALVLDLNGQYVYYYELLHDAFYGERSLIYSWSRNLSGELFGIFAYYLASPFMLIICLLPRAIMPTSVLVMILAKVGTASVTFMFFLKKIGIKKPSGLVAFSLLYSLMSYMTVQFMDPMWLDGLIYLPLIMWGVHRLVEDGKVLPLTIPLGLMFIAHFYIGYMIGFFTALYFVFVCLTRKDKIIPDNFITVCLKFFVSAVVAVMCAAIVLIPVYNSLKLGKFEFTDPDFSARTQFTLTEFLAKLFPLSYDTVYPSGLPMIYCGTLTLLLVPLYFLNSKIELKEKIGAGLLTLALIICMWIAPIDMAWHGFQVPNWLPFRYSFCFSAVLLVMAARTYENLEGVSTKAMGGTLFGLFACIMYLESCEFEFLKPFRTVLEDGEEINVIQGITLGIIAVAVFYILVTIIRLKGSKIAAVIMIGCVCAELFANTLDTFVKNDSGINPDIEGYTGLSYSTYNSYAPYMHQLRSVVNKVKDENEGFYRMEATFHRTVNDPMGTNYAGISHSSSTMNAPVLTMLKYLGYAYGGHYTKYDGATPLTDAVFNIKYLMNRQDDDYRSQEFIPTEYNLKYSLGETLCDIEVYENPYALAMGMTASRRISRLVLDPYDPFTNQNNLLNYILDDSSDTQYFERVYPESTDTENMSIVTVSDNHTKYEFTDRNYGECHIDYNFTMTSDSPLYMFLPTRYERKVNVWVASSSEGFVPEDSGDFDYVGSFFTGDDYSIMELGQFKTGDSVRVRISVLTDDYEAYWMDELFCTFNYNAFENAISQMKERTWELTEYSDTYLEGTVTAKENQMLFTTIPYEEGWTIEVDGKEVTPVKTLDSLIAINLSPGEHTVTMKFWPGYLTQAIIISVCGILALVLIFIFEYKNGKIINIIINKTASTK